MLKKNAARWLVAGTAIVVTCALVGLWLETKGTLLNRDHNSHNSSSSVTTATLSGQRTVRGANRNAEPAVEQYRTPPVDRRAELVRQLYTVSDGRPVNEEYAGLRDVLTKSGPTSQPWANTAREMLETTLSQWPAIHATIECYDAGCIADIRYAVGDTDSNAEITKSFMHVDWSGGRMITGVRSIADGTTANAVILTPTVE